MLSLFAQSELKDLIEKVENGERLDFKAGVRLMKSKDILALGYMANLLRERKNGDQTYFMVDRCINPMDLRTKEVPGAHWLEIQNVDYRLGMEANAAMIYGQNETMEEQIDQLLHLREFQDKTGELLTFAPVPFYTHEQKFEGNMGVDSTTGFEDLRMLAVSRILLDNFNHIKAFWMLLGPKLAQVSLKFGVDDLEGTVVEVKNVQAIGAENEQAMSKKAIIKMIHRAGRHAIERDTLYQVVMDYGHEGGQNK